ncbi:hypothetical protein HOLleu_41875 [Holothuria leucospilota]|uniref:Uncharacterized protein n=1 Tax=Holothuria leucospilota TaxID=206669 RepID=A0A9Q0YES9_HOLLE|nr:hypothetical protein HOLleu_41875 [Holothuria leucospilota]
MTRLLNTLKTVIEGEDPNSDTVEELPSKSQEGFTAIEAIHEELMNTAEDEEVESLEAWMEECHTSFWKVRSSANKYLASKSEGNHNSNNDVTAEISSPRSTADSSSLKNFNEIKLALELPKAEFTEFDGNPVDFYAFLSNFETNVESKLSNNATRLQYLLQMCKGKARCSIECCALLGDDGYVQAKSILSRQFGQPHMILNALMNELLNKKPLKPNDAGYTSDLNSTTSLLKIQSLLPTYLQTAWAKKAHEILYDDREPREPEFVDMLKFLEWHAEISCTMFGRSVSKPQVSNDRFKNKASVKSNNVSSIPFKCYLCEGNHSIYTCSKLIEAAYEEKLKMVKAAKLCFRCLRPGHGALKCRKDWTCRSCGSSRHHNKLHPPPKEESKSPAEQQVMSNAASNGNRVYLRILPVVVTTHNGYQVSTLALLDHGSDTSLCSESFRKKLKVRGKRVKYTSSTINGDEEREGFKFDVSVKGKHEKQGMTIDFLSVPKIPAAAESVPRAEDLSKWRHLESLPWENQQSDEVGLLIGADAPEAFWVLEERKGKPKEPYAMRTMLGWSIMGPGGSGNNRVTSHRIEVSNEQLFQEVEKSWAVENTGLSEEKDSIQDIRAREIMKSTIKLTKDGHYEMGLLWKHDNHDLPHSRSMAESRLASLKRRLESNKEMHGKYTEVVEGYIAKGFAEPVNTRESKPGPDDRARQRRFKVPMVGGDDMSKSPKEYRMCVHLFGATSSPCCAGKALKQTAEDNEIDNQDEVLLKEKPLTRRGLLSITSSFYDPLGFAAPFILVAKSLLQEVCKRGADWDEPLTDREHEEKGYGAVAYLRTQSAEDVSCRFVVGKARVSPLKSVSIPRLELMSAVLAATLDGAIRREMRYEFGETIFWSDSMIVLNYLRNESTRFKTFVANRVAKIRSVSKPHQWRHVGTKDNPADEGSRGTFHIRKWLTGPDFLTKDKVCWPESKFEDVDLTEDPEVKRSNTVQRAKVLQTNVTEDDNSLLTILVGKYSSWTRLVRVLSWIRRFIRSARNKAKNETYCDR